MKPILSALLVACLLTLSAALPADARDRIRIAGSSTVAPFVSASAEYFARTTDFRAPVVESIGTGSGFQLFCAGTGDTTTDIATASRAIKPVEKALCDENLVGPVIELKLGYDGIVLAASRDNPPPALTRAMIWQALARNVWNGTEWVSNPHENWADIDPSLPQREIRILGPPPTSGTRDAFAELVMDAGCRAGNAQIDGMDEERAKALCRAMREDGRFVEAGENDNLIVQKLGIDPQAMGLFGWSFLDQNADQVAAASIDGVAPEFDAIADGSYPVARPLYLYVKVAHLERIPGLEAFLRATFDEEQLGEFGRMLDRGLIPLDAAQRDAMRRRIESRASIYDTSGTKAGE